MRGRARARRSTVTLGIVLSVLLTLLPPLLGDAHGRAATGPVNPTVVAAATPSSGAAPLTVTFRANGSGGFGPYAFAWDFGDGTAGASGASVSHLFASYGNYTTVVTLTDYYGATATSSVAVDVAPTPLSVSVVAEPATVTVEATALFATTIRGGVGPYTVLWSGLPPGCPRQAVENYSCQPTAAGNYTLSATVTDARGTSATGTARLTVLGPAAGPGGTASPPPATEPSLVVFAVGGVALGAVAAILGVVLVRRRRRVRPAR